jgi:hypothetical protein
MQKIFHNILMPVGLNSKTGYAIDKAIEFANQLECHVHFLFMMKTTFFSWNRKGNVEAEKKMRMYALKEKYREKLKKGLRLFSQFQNGDIENIIVKYAETHAIDMILLDNGLKGPAFFHDSLDPGWLADCVNCPVLTIRSSPDVQPFKTIVLPIGTIMPVNKMRIAVCLAKQFDSSIHLVVLEKNSLMYEEMACMKRVFQVLKNNTDLPLVCITVQGKSLEDAALQYGHSVKGSLIIMNPGHEPFVAGFINWVSSMFGSKGSEVPVITVA